MGLEATIRLYDRQERFKGDVSPLQSFVLSWLIGDELIREQEQKRQDYEIMALAANQGANPHLIKSLQKETETPDEEAVEWFTPQSEEEIQNVLERFNGLPI